ncbi:hypothetical protein E2C01_096864 [Portunus trituberculatus]|uniref:Uncharacterized protein n=1 Tax=Portunus trituberculatus TaxID=210409 RepID=A0A5B7JYX9_PORTR|nr:hypothetical protein [Portunus trituberculatus]
MGVRVPPKHVYTPSHTLATHQPLVVWRRRDRVAGRGAEGAPSGDERGPVTLHAAAETWRSCREGERESVTQ